MKVAVMFDVDILPFYFTETTYTAALTYMSGTTLGFGLDDIRKNTDMEKIIVSVFNQVG